MYALSAIPASSPERTYTFEGKLPVRLWNSGERVSSVRMAIPEHAVCERLVTSKITTRSSLHERIKASHSMEKTYYIAVLLFGFSWRQNNLTILCAFYEVDALPEWEGRQRSIQIYALAPRQRVFRSLSNEEYFLQVDNAT